MNVRGQTMLADPTTHRAGPERFAGMELAMLAQRYEPSGVFLSALDADGSAPVRYSMACRIITAAGAVGQCYVNLLGVGGEQMANWMGKHLMPVLERCDLAQPWACWDAMFATTRSAFFERVLAIRAIGLLDCALWDLYGQLCGRSLVSLWGQRSRALEVLLLCSSLDPAQTIGASRARLASMMAEGYAGLKVKVGAQGGHSVAADVTRIADVRRVVGGKAHIVADANQFWNVDEAVEFAEGVRDLDLLWLEEPCHWESDAQDIARLKGRVPGGRVAAGQMESTVQGCERLIDTGRIDVVNYDAALGGGATAWLRVASLAAARGVEPVHHIEPQLGLALGCVSEGTKFVEVCEDAIDPFFRRMVANAPRIVNGRMTPPDGSGWGWTYDEDFIRRATVRRWRWRDGCLLAT